MMDGRDETPPGRRQRARRPRAVSFVASLVLAEAATLVLVAALGWLGMVALDLRGPTLIVERTLAAEPGQLAAGEPGRLVSPIVVGGVLGSAVMVLAGVGLLRMHAWAWSLATVAHGVALADALAGYVVGRPQYELMAIGSLVVLVLNQREVRHAILPEYRAA